MQSFELSEVHGAKRETGRRLGEKVGRKARRLSFITNLANPIISSLDDVMHNAWLIDHDTSLPDWNAFRNNRRRLIFSGGWAQWKKVGEAIDFKASGRTWEIYAADQGSSPAAGITIFPIGPGGWDVSIQFDGSSQDFISWADHFCSMAKMQSSK